MATQPFGSAMMLRNASIRAYLLHLVAAVALPFVVLEVWNLYAGAETDSQRALQQVLHLARITARETYEFLGGVKDMASGLAARPAVRALDPAYCDPILKDLLALAPRFANLVTLDMEGRVICSAVPVAQLRRDLRIRRAAGHGPRARGYAGSDRVRHHDAGRQR